ncbi:MAG: N-acetyl-gamma-glutamyl-phosphate reductase [Deltaproteobacteria bacterium]|nr:N-acetyl-gamma-glutamyl-phosphate reductase [Deltaproteobacteria bacterium]
MIKVAIFGGSGYTGFELLRILGNHHFVEVLTITSRQHKGCKIEEVFPGLNRLSKLAFEDHANSTSLQKADIIFSALPHHTSMEIVPNLIKNGKRVIDLSADFRLKDADIYEAWYGKHIAKGLLKKAVYGLSELYRDKIKHAELIANPGCYPTGAILALAPLLKAGIIDTDGIIIDSKSGISGAGRAASLDTSFAEVNEGFKAYKVGEHRHMPEIEQEISLIAGKDIKITFTPHLLPVNRGILSTIYTSIKSQKPAPAVSKQGSKAQGQKEMVFDTYKKYYNGEFFVRILPDGIYPNISQVKGSNFCDIGFKVDERTGRLIVITAIDNLVKGASGQAVQNMNIMLGIPETTGLVMPPLSV